jgi:peroxiredoxin
VSALPQRRPQATARVLLSVAALLGSAAAGGFFLYRLIAPPHSSLYSLPEPARTARRERPPTPEETSPTPAPIPEQLPPITLPGLDGTMHALAEWHGKPLLINFWATWCEPCRREVPLLRSVRHKRSSEGLEVVGIAIDSVDAVRQYVGTHGMDYPVLVSEEGGLAAATAFGMGTVLLPFSVFADRRGRIVTVKVGELHPDEADLILDRLRQLDAGTLTLAAARQQITDGVRRLGLQRAPDGAS